jgi:hypothetical protein
MALQHVRDTLKLTAYDHYDVQNLCHDPNEPHDLLICDATATSISSTASGCSDFPVWMFFIPYPDPWCEGDISTGVPCAARVPSQNTVFGGSERDGLLVRLATLRLSARRHQRRSRKALGSFRVGDHSPRTSYFASHNAVSGDLSLRAICPVCRLISPVKVRD